MKPDWRSDLSICMAGFTAERIGHNLRGESIYRNDIVGVSSPTRHFRVAGHSPGTRNPGGFAGYSAR
jgi:hypothetical protein